MNALAWAALATVVAVGGGCRNGATPALAPPASKDAVARSAPPMPSAAPSAGVEPAPPAPPVAPPPPSVATAVVKVASDVKWLRAARGERAFRRAALDGSGPVHIVWNRGRPHADSDPNRPIARIALELTRDGRTTRVEVGDVAGEILPEGASFCARLNYRVPSSNTPLALYPPTDGMVSKLSVGDASGADDFLVMLGPGVLYVLHTQTSDGLCEREIKQGPLEVCQGSEYARIAEVTLAPAAAFEESIRTTSEDAGIATPLDCATPTIMGSLAPPDAGDAG
jgi:hypothetical protein